MRLVVLMAAGFIALVGLLGYVFWTGHRKAQLTEQRAAIENRMRCLEAERRLADYKAKNGVRYGETEAETRAWVWTCRGSPANIAPGDL